VLKRYLIHHRPRGTWDLVVENGKTSVERVQRGQRVALSLEEFQASEDGKKLERFLRFALERAARKTPEDDSS